MEAKEPCSLPQTPWREGWGYNVVNTLPRTYGKTSRNGSSAKGAELLPKDFQHIIVQFELLCWFQNTFAAGFPHLLLFEIVCFLWVVF